MSAVYPACADCRRKTKLAGGTQFCGTCLAKRWREERLAKEALTSRLQVANEAARNMLTEATILQAEIVTLKEQLTAEIVAASPTMTPTTPTTEEPNFVMPSAETP